MQFFKIDSPIIFYLKKKIIDVKIIGGLIIVTLIAVSALAIVMMIVNTFTK